MSKFEKRMYLIALGIFACVVIFCYVGVNTLTNITRTDCNCNPKFYDYIIDLKQEGIHVYREDGREFFVEHDSLDEFIIKDNI
jgi:hypothetical protein